MDKSDKSRFNEMKDLTTRANESKLTTRLRKRNITLKDAEKLLKDVISGNINKKWAKNMYSNIGEDAYELNKLNPTKYRTKALTIFKQLQEIFMGSKADEEKDDETLEEADDDVDDEVDDETDKQFDPTDVPELESEESAAQTKEPEGKGLNILTSEQMFSRLSIS